MTRALLLVLSGCGGLSSHHWIGSSCETSIAPSRAAVAFHDDGGKKLVLRRDDGDHELAYPKCVTRARLDGVIALADGWRVLVWGFDVSGGNGFEHGEIEIDFTCVVDFRDGSTKELNPQTFSWDLRHFAPTVGATTGWIYNHEVAAEVVVVDLATEKAEKLELAGQTIVEVGPIARTLVPDDTGITIQDYDTTTWPPAPREPRRIAVHGQARTLAISSDGRWAAYTGGGIGDIYDLGLVDLETGTIAFEQLHQQGDIRLGDVVSAGDDAWVLLVHTSNPMPVDRDYEAMWLDRTGAIVGKAKDLGTTSNPPTLTWMPSRARVAANGGCNVELLDLPPPAKVK